MIICRVPVALCSYSTLLSNGTPCGQSSDYPGQLECVALKDCTKDVFKLSNNTPINSKVQNLPRATSQAFELLKIGLFKFPPLGAKKPFKCPLISTELPLLKDKFRLQSNTLTPFRERYAE